MVESVARPTETDQIKKRLDHFATWQSLRRPHASLGILTPSEAELRLLLPDRIYYTEESELEPQIRIKRDHVGDDSRLLYPVIKVKPKYRFVA